MKNIMTIKKNLILFLTLVCTVLLMDSRFYIDYILHQKSYTIEDAVITNIDYYPNGKSGSYQSSVEYKIENQSLTRNIRTSIGDYVGKEITIGVNKDNSYKILPDKFMFQRKTIVHSIFIISIILYSIYLIINLFRKNSNIKRLR
ncbi:hypothetical protein SR42_13770 [Clostridium botulinum]|uniref:hypothetical protein n=1 Tax=Clostridium botulinum TaxID=1491 RepID=UPI00059792EC|nr:hypothetical protein [Clostridium botulinum]KIL07253.1 hypothetical protein SR42_13770 [Clostridium botulinum]MBN1058692.1 hypothetical protein [Clostridium botulinum]MBY6934288.1 hypothetical protein [Clostridium botulinum]NFL83329.1 hypothetical protein [Clostridium botulinum]NFL87819.1 hypothetical protein [Clostridium botulinum]